MAAKIIQFPGNACTTRPGSACASEETPLDLSIECVDADVPLVQTATVGAGDSLADLHRLITELFRWDDAHNYFFSHGSCRYEDPVLFRSQDRVSARCRRIYSAADVPVGAVLNPEAPPLFYVYNLAGGWELRISLADDVSLTQFG